MKKHREKTQNFDQKSFAGTIRQNAQFQAQIITIISPIFGIIYTIAGINVLQIIDFIHRYLPEWKPHNISFFFANLAMSWLIVPLILASLFQYLLSPKCPNCSNHLLFPSIQLASGFCPHCRKRLFKNIVLTGIKLPHDSLVKIHDFALYTMLSFIVVSCIIIYPIIQYIKEYYWEIIGAFIFLEGAASLLFPFYVFFLSRFKRWRTAKLPKCKVCGETLWKDVLTLTGNCCNCGSPNDPDWPPPEPEPIADLPTWQEFSSYQGKFGLSFIISFLVAFALSGIMFFIGFKHTESYGMYLILAGFLLLFPTFISVPVYMEHQAKKKRDKSLVHYECPYCGSSSLPLRNFERCLKCRRRLIKRTDADEN